MKTPRANIVQAEFFLAEKDGASFTDFLDKFGGRIKDGSQIRIAVRFFDGDGSLTKIVMEAGELRKHDEKLKNSFRGTSRMRQWALDNQSRDLGNKIFILREQIRSLAVMYLHEVIKASREVATQCSKRLFHYTNENEKHELMEVVRASTGILVFVFRPSNLLSETNILVASAT